MIFGNPYWSAQTKLDLLGKWLIIHSIIYYELNTSIVPDQMFDANARQFVEMAKEHPDHFSRSRWMKVMHDFDGSTGFHLYSKLSKSDKAKLLHIATYLVETIKN